MFGKQKTGTGEFFKPAKEDPRNVYVLECNGFEADVPGQFGLQDHGYAKAYIFTDGKGEPEVRDILTTNGPLSRTIRDAVGEAPLLVKLGKGTSKKTGNEYWLFEDQDESDYPEVVAFFQQKAEEEAPPAL